ncbi:protein APEM9 [Sesamum alatum]|uniref:Protein APEM9 n=1 Tax=Sesamum alatum TaxID=300844 RepID=A0AAE1YMH8_9LAMI|nr:protein APEM9 [Sesamum alatum]
MAMIDEQMPIWEEIDRAESYLICCVFDEATSLASSIIKRLLANYSSSSKGCEVQGDCENEWGDMLESAGMVLVQSMKQLQRTSEILKELKLLFGSITAIPVQVFLTGVCFQMSESPSATVQGSLEEFLNNWRFEDNRYHPVLGAEANESDPEGSCFSFSIGVDEYLEVVELYVVTLLAMTQKDTDLAISWVEKAMLPVEKCQELLRRLRSMNSSVVTSSSQTSTSSQLPDKYNGHHKDIDSEYLSCEGNTAKEEILKLSRQRVPRYLWFPNITLKLGDTRLVVPSGKMLLATLLLLIYYFTRKKHAVLKRVLMQKALSVKKALLDLWQLAFSYQVNPLAALQPLPTATHGSH